MLYATAYGVHIFFTTHQKIPQTIQIYKCQDNLKNIKTIAQLTKQQTTSLTALPALHERHTLINIQHMQTSECSSD
jgi:hypothetical protein